MRANAWKAPRRAAAALAALAALAAICAPRAAADARFEAASLDGSIVFFSTDEAPARLGDTDRKADVYVRSYDSDLGEYVTRKVSTGPQGGNDALDAFFVGASEDGTRAFFHTREALVAEDRDRAADIYMRDLTTRTTVLVSRGEAPCEAAGCGNAEAGVTAVPRGVTPDGSKVFFITTERLTAEDGDNAADIYVRDVDAETTELVSRGDASCAGAGCGSGEIPVLGFDDASEDGTKVVFRTEERLHADDEDGGAADIYQRDLLAGTTSLVSEPGDCPACVANYGASSADGSHVVFETEAALDPADGDDLQDVYDWTSAGGAVLASRPGPACEDGCGEAAPATFPGVVSGFPGISADGERIVFETAERLVGADGDESNDVYERSGAGTTALVSHRHASCEPSGCGEGELPAQFRWLSPDGSGAAVIFGTAERLADGDTDQSQDLYRRLGGETALISAGDFGGDAEQHASFAGASHDGARVFAITAEQLAGEDADEAADIYAIEDGTATLISAAQFPLAGNGPFGAGLEGVSADGSHAFFTTDERLTLDDDDGGERDVYQRTAEGTVLVSTGNVTSLGPAPPSGLHTDPPSPGTSSAPSIRGEADAGSSVLVYGEAGCAGEPLRAGTAEQLGGGGIQVSVKAGSTSRFWLSAEADGITSECAGPVTYVHAGAPPQGGGGAGGGAGQGGGAGGASPKPRSSRPVGQPGPSAIRYVRPRTRITFGPSFKTKRRKAVFRFTDRTGQPGTRFLCKVDRRKWRRCGSPLRVKRLTLGFHVVRVKGVNARGEAERRPAKRRFRVVRR